MEVLRDKTVKIKKTQRCFACLRKFEPGTLMRAQTNKQDGRLCTVYNCETCGILMNKFSRHLIDDVENIYPEGCVCEMYDNMKVGNPEGMLKLLTQ